MFWKNMRREANIDAHSVPSFSSELSQHSQSKHPKRPESQKIGPRHWHHPGPLTGTKCNDLIEHMLACLSTLKRSQFHFHDLNIFPVLFKPLLYLLTLSFL